MALIDVDFFFDADGPIFDGTADDIVGDWLNDVTDSFAQQGLSRLHQEMDHYFRDPTPYYETQVTISNHGDTRVIHDRGVIYGPWLDGSGSRNATTRFKGYPHWRRTLQYLEEEEGPAIIERRWPELLRRLGV